MSWTRLTVTCSTLSTAGVTDRWDTAERHNHLCPAHRSVQWTQTDKGSVRCWLHAGALRYTRLHYDKLAGDMLTERHSAYRRDLPRTGTDSARRQRCTTQQASPSPSPHVTALAVTYMIYVYNSKYFNTVIISSKFVCSDVAWNKMLSSGSK